MEMCGALAVEDAVERPTVLCRSEPLEALLGDGRVLAVVVGVHLYI